MNIRHLAVGAACLALGLLGATSTSLARGAAVNIMNSPGYQRALADSRKQLIAPASTAQPIPPPTSAKRHRRHH